ncbi:Acetyltransferase (GNAT) family protein [Jannaschia seohaensis]|uniref:Acetyltransferase (GNAT) family protein n=2 Tax=Jannaschia seohaensis TaxID=475081 RepID=A0A2Y9B532_9RHOB|nr:acetyltransferase (GNAT) family protein [Jannaschia seohaensis]SSA51521.1 Acetyltransferase (GNAT) family protein [Jannaschia seohaensis]
MKHLYVRPEARGTGLGRRLVEARMQAAREIGLRSVVADTFTGNPEMPVLYRSLGFRVVPPFHGSASIGINPDLAEHMTHFRYDL